MAVSVRPRARAAWRRRAVGLLAAAITAGSALAAGGVLSPSVHAEASFDQIMLGLINQDRAGSGLPPLAWYGSLGTIAENGPYGGCGYLVDGRAYDLGIRNYFSHTILNCGSQSVFDMMNAYGVPFTSAGENLGAEFGDPDAATAAAHINQLFMSEVAPNDGHKRNILSPAYTHVAVGSWHSPPGQVWTPLNASNVYVTEEAFAALPPASTGPPAAAVQPNAVDFGTQAKGTTSGAQTVTLYSRGSSLLHVSSVTVGGPNAADYRVVPGGCAGMAVTPGASCSVTVTFTPGSSSPSAASLLFADDASDSPQPAALGGNDGGAVLTPTEKYVERAYADLLGRAADPGGLAYWSTAIDNGTPRDQIAVSFTTCTECRQAEITTLYQHYLHRAPTSTELSTWVNAIGGNSSYEDLIGALTGSDEYYQLHGGGLDPTTHINTFVQAVYQDVLNRAADSSGLAYWDQQLANGAPRSAVANAFSHSTEYYTLLVTTDYENLLRRAPDPGGLSFWVTSFQGGTRDERMVSNFVGSDEYYHYAQVH